MQNNKQQETGQILNIHVFWEQFLRRWYVLLTVFILSLVLFFIGAKLFLVPQYNSTAKLYIFNTESELTGTSEITISTYLARDYVEFIGDRTVLNAVIKDLNLNMSYNGLRNAVSVESLENTRIIAVTVTTDDPKLSPRIANCICKVAQEKLVELMGISRVNIISEAYMPTGPISTATEVGFSYGLAFGAVLCCGLLFFYVFTDDKIKSGEDVENYLGISVLSTIPYSQPRNRVNSSVGRTSAR